PATTSPLPTAAPPAGVPPPAGTTTPATAGPAPPATSGAATLTVIPAQTVTGVSNAVFSPDQASSAGVQDNTVITIRNPGTVLVSNITCRIRSGTALGGTLVRELTIGALGAGLSGTATWDGKDGTGALVAEG